MLTHTHTLARGVELVMLEPRHADALYVATEANRAYLRRWLPWLDETRSPRDSLEFIQRALRQLAEGRGLTTAIEVDGEIAGRIGQVSMDWRSRATSHGYWLAEPQQGRGYITMACTAYLAYTFDARDLNRVEIRAAVANRKSRAIPERLGFQLEGVIRDAEWLYEAYVDHAVYGLLRADWREALASEE